MKPIFTLVFATVSAMTVAGTGLAQDAQTAMANATGEAVATDAAPPADAPATAAPADTAAAPETLQFMDARDVDVRDFIWSQRIIVVMADTPDDPLFARQLAALRDRADEFVLRDAVVIFDAHPDDASPLRQVLRPRGFMSAIIDKDGEVKARRPSFRTGRELMAVIDRFPTRRQEVLERLPSGR